MRPFNICLAVGVLFGLAFGPNTAQSMTVELGEGGADLVLPGQTWRYSPGLQAPSDPADAWKDSDFDDSSWALGPSGFGYGDNDDATVLDDMHNHYVTVYIRKEFSVPTVIAGQIVELVIDYDDGFIAYLNGKEVAHRNMPGGPATYETTAVSHEAGTPETIVLGKAEDLLIEGTNLLAVEGHNVSVSSTDFSLIPALRTSSDVLRNGDTWIVNTETVGLWGTVEDVNAVRVTAGDIAAEFEPAEGAWAAQVPLDPGFNAVDVLAWGADGNEVDAAQVGIVRVSPDSILAGTLVEDVNLAGAYIVEDTLSVPNDVTVRLEPGTWLLMKDGASLVVSGRLLAEGTQDAPVYFTRYGNQAAWDQIIFVEAADSLLSHCVFEYADSEGEHQDYYLTGPRNYHEAVVVLAGHVDVNDCTFRNLPDENADAEGDALAIISDDPNHPGAATANITGCQFLSIGQGVHTRYAYVLVDDCFFTGKRGDNDDVDLYGESDPPPVVRDNLFLNPEHDDMINPTKCSAVIIGNILSGSDDHGIVLRDRSFPVVMNNVINDCANGGIAIENTCDALLINNTIVDCGRGLRLFDLGRWGPPYNLNPGGGTATAINCIIWDCSEPITLADSSSIDIEDRGSHITLRYCDISDGQAGVSISGSHSTMTWQEGNFNADPLFADPDHLDFHLKSAAGRWDPNDSVWVTDDVSSPCLDAGDPESSLGKEPDPNGSRVNLGAYGGTEEASKSP